MDAKLLQDIKNTIKGEVSDDPETITKFSHDASIFELKPDVVVVPLNTDDVKTLVNLANKYKPQFPDLSITPRSAGTDMSGGALTESIALSMTEHFNNIKEVEGDTITVQPGVYYRDFEKKTLQKNMIFPSYPVSREICAMGGIIGNNAGGEKSLEYGKAERYIKALKVVLSDGNEYEFRELTIDQLREKLSKKDFEGDIYRNIYKLINDNYDLIKKSKPSVTKNSSGYSLWNVYDKDKKTFDLTQLFVGAQGTLGVITEATIKLVPLRKHSEMVVIQMRKSDIPKLGEIINTVLPFKPESFETYDDNTLKLAVKYFTELGAKIGLTKLNSAINFFPEIVSSIIGNLPKLVLLAEFTGDDQGLLRQKATELEKKLSVFNLKIKRGGSETQSKKYWIIRRESFSLLKNKIKNMHASPFIDDFAVEPKYLSEFLPKLDKIMSKYPSIISTIAGHIGDGNFHIIPLVRLEEEKEREIIKSLGREVFDLVLEYHGSTSGEHNDGLIRTAYLKQMFGSDVYNLFVETKRIFDPLNIFNPGKKIEISDDFFMEHIRKVWS